MGRLWSKDQCNHIGKAEDYDTADFLEDVRRIANWAHLAKEEFWESLP
jgi:hypothetical protein